MNIELRPLADIKPYERNPRINDDAVEAVARSIRQFGFRQPIVVDDEGIIVVGHTRWKAAAKLGLEHVPVYVARELTAEQTKAYRIADNKTGDLATWDLELLPVELSELQALDVDLSLLGFGEDELAKFLDVELTEGLTDPDEVPEPPDEAITQPGDLWVMDNHRLLCGDSASSQDVNRLLDGQPVHLVNTDPPYNVKVEPRSNNAIAAGNSSFSLLKSQQLTQAVGATWSSRGLHHHPRPSTWLGRAQSMPLTRGSAPRTGHWPTTSFPTKSSIRCFTHGSEISAAYLHPGVRSTSGAATPTAATTRRS
ncbi:MAG: ParB N-terminal domain-containing protein [Phycisphaerae bacterium]